MFTPPAKIRRREESIHPVYIIAGQSNAGMQGDAIDLPANLQIADATTPHYVDSGVPSGWIPLAPTGSKFGPEITFGHKDAPAPVHPAGSIYQFFRGATSLAVDWNPDTPGLTWTQFVNSVAVALATHPDPRVKVVGFFWIQGERDARDLTEATDYGANLANFVDKVRELFGAALPFKLVRLHIDADVEFGDLVRSGQETQTDNWIDIDDLTLQGDDLHYTSATCEAVGTRGAAALSS